MQALVDFIVRNLLALWPIARVYEWQVAMLVRGGFIVRPLGPGLHWRWLFIEEVMTWNATANALDLAAGAVTTTDGRRVTISANCRYRIVDIAAYYRNVWSTKESLGCTLLGILCTSCAGRAWPDLIRDRRGLEAALLAEVSEVVACWGIAVDAVNLTDLVLTTAHHHYTDGSMKGAA